MTAKPIKLFATQPHPCSYLEGEEATTLFVDPDEAITVELYTRLSNLGFRRSGPHLYKPHCAQCNQCIASRVDCNGFKLSRSDRRVLNRNKDLVISFTDSIESSQYYDLFERYINERHADGDMYPPSYEQYSDFLGSHSELTKYMSVTDNQGALVLVSVYDDLPDGLSAVYTFFDPSLSSLSLGKWAILKQIEMVQTSQRSYLYLGYYISECQKMAYKNHYQPMEILQNDSWTPLIR